MRKFIMGLLIGSGLMLAFNVSAAVESIIGKSVEGTAAMKLDGKKLDKDVIIVDGSSYAPVRVIGEALNSEVDFKDGEVIMTTKRLRVSDGPRMLADYEAVIKSRKEQTEVLESMLNKIKRDNPERVDYIKDYEQKLEMYKNETAELEKQKAELESSK